MKFKHSFIKTKPRFRNFSCGFSIPIGNTTAIDLFYTPSVTKFWKNTRNCIKFSIELIDKLLDFHNDLFTALHIV